MAVEALMQINDAELKRLMRQFQRLENRVAQKVSRQAVSAGATPIARRMRQGAPVGPTGNLRRAIGRRTKTYRDNATSVAVIGAKIGGSTDPSKRNYDAKGTKLGYHANLIEDGHVAVDGSFVPGNPFMRRAVDAAEPESIARMRNKLFEGIDKEAARS